MYSRTAAEPKARRWRSRAIVALAAACGFVMATDVAFASNWSVTLASGSTAIAEANPAPAAPGSVAATCTSSGTTTVKVNWGAVSRASSYTIWASNLSSSAGYSVFASGVTGTSYTTPSLTIGLTYWFEVEARSGTNWSSTNSAGTTPGRTIGLGTCS